MEIPEIISAYVLAKKLFIDCAYDYMQILDLDKDEQATEYDDLEKILELMP